MFALFTPPVGLRPINATGERTTSEPLLSQPGHTTTGMAISWKRRTSPGPRRAHAFAQIDLHAGFRAIEPFGACGSFTVTRLLDVPADYPDRCHACIQAITRTLAGVLHS